MLEQCLQCLEQLCTKLKVNLANLALPHLGCGLDQLEWKYVARIVHEVFKKSATKVIVYSNVGI